MQCHKQGNTEIIFHSLYFRAKNAALTKKRFVRVTKIYEAKKNLKSLTFFVARPISLEMGKLFQLLSSNKKFVKVCTGQIFSKDIENFALNFVFFCHQLIF